MSPPSPPPPLPRYPPQAREAFQGLIDAMYERLPKGEDPPTNGGAAARSNM